MKLDVKQRLLVVALLPATLLAVAMAAYFIHAGVSALDSELRQRGEAMVRYLAPASEYGVLSGQIDLLQTQAQAAVKQSAVKAVLVLGRDGRILAVSGRVSLSADDLRRPLAEPSLVTQSDRWIGFGAPIVRSLAEVDGPFNQESAVAAVRKSGPIGKVFVEMDCSEVFAKQQALLIRSLLIVLAGLALAAAYAIRVASRAVAPLNRLVSAVSEMSTGNYQARVPAITDGEFGVLENGFNDMAMHIEGSHREMQWRIEEATAHLAFQARHDALTNLINRREFEVRLEQTIAAVHSGGIEVSVLLMDLDHFKLVNDTSGHLAGDELLRQLARLFQGRLREKDSLARIGGDEFAIILPDCSQVSALRVAEEICQLTTNYRLVWQEQVFRVGVSIGLVMIGDEMRAVNDVLSAADAACYAAKDTGRNCVHVHTSIAPTESRISDGRWHEKIKAALDERRLRCDVTPIRPLLAGGVGHVSDCSLADVSISPDGQSGMPLTAPIFRDMAERAGLAQRVDDCALAMVLEALSLVSTHAMVCAPILLLPLSVSTIKSSESPKHIASLLKLHSRTSQGLCVVLPEDAVIRHIGEAGVLCAALREAGCKVALTDFGGWLASFNHLDVVCPDLIRINVGLTHDLHRNRSAAALVRAIQEISVDRGIYTIAEGVDDAESLAVLQELGINYIQGRAVAPVEPLEAWIEGGVLRSS